MSATREALQACREGGVEDWFLTAWGDDGDECSKFAVLPAVMYAARIAGGTEDMSDIKKKFREITGADFDTFMLLDKLNVDRGNTGSYCKYLLYTDVFMGFEDPRHREEKEDGRKTRRYYRENDREALKKLAEEDYVQTISAVREFYRVYRRLWMTEKKPHGFDVQDIRMGGLMQRLESCKERIEEYLRGETDSIPELEEEILQASCKRPWRYLVTCNVMSD